MFQAYLSSKVHYTIDWEYYEWGDNGFQFIEDQWEVMFCYITNQTMTCTLSVQDFTDMKIERGFTVQALFQACVDLAESLGLEKIVYVHDRYSVASLQLAAILEKSAEKIQKEFYNEAEFFWYEITNYIYYV